MVLEVIGSTVEPLESAAAQEFSVETWLNLVFTAAALVFAIWSYWSSSLSKKARIAAEKAEKNADRRVEAAEATAAELQKLVENLQLPPLVATATGDKGIDRLMIRNTTGNDIEVVSVLNQADFSLLEPESALPNVIHRGAQFGMFVAEDWCSKNPSNLHLLIRESGVERHVHVPIPHVS